MDHAIKDAAGTYPELQFENQTEQLALAHLKADTGEIEQLRECISEQLALLPTSIPEISVHRAALAAAQTDAFCQAILDQRPEYLQEFATPNPPALA